MSTDRDRLRRTLAGLHRPGHPTGEVAAAPASEADASEDASVTAPLPVEEVAPTEPLTTTSEWLLDLSEVVTISPPPPPPPTSAAPSPARAAPPVFAPVHLPPVASPPDRRVGEVTAGATDTHEVVPGESGVSDLAASMASPTTDVPDDTVDPDLVLMVPSDSVSAMDLSAFAPAEVASPSVSPDEEADPALESGFEAPVSPRWGIAQVATRSDPMLLDDPWSRVALAVQQHLPQGHVDADALLAAAMPALVGRAAGQSVDGSESPAGTGAGTSGTSLGAMPGAAVGSELAADPNAIPHGVASLGGLARRARRRREGVVATPNRASDVSETRPEVAPRRRAILARGIAGAMAVLALALLAYLGVLTPRYYVRFAITAPRAEKVSVVGDFNAWDPFATPMARQPRSGGWEVWVRLRPGTHRFRYWIDGRAYVGDGEYQGAPGAAREELSGVIVIPRGGGMPSFEDAPVLPGATRLRQVPGLVPSP